MGLSRGMYTKEFKRAAVQRLEQGVSLGEVAARPETIQSPPLNRNFLRY